MKKFALRIVVTALLCTISIGLQANAVQADNEAKEEIKLTSAGPIAFGPKGLLLVSDPMEATIFAIETGDTEGSTDGVTIAVEDIRAKIASMMGATAKELRINDLAVNPINGTPYLSVTRGSGESEVSTILTVNPKSKEISVFELAGKTFTKTSFTNAAESRRTRGGDQRLQAITDMAFVDGQIYVAGLSNEEFASNLRAIAYPFSETNNGCSIEIYHGAHGKYETRSPIRTFAAMETGEEINLLAAYTCTPLVRIPVSDLKPKTKVKGTTIAELGNRNRPLDMVVYKKDDKNYALMANSSRGVMKIDLADAPTSPEITNRVSGTSGTPYETIKELSGVMQLDGLSKTHGVVLVRDESGKEDLKTIVLP
ncbi:MAG: hypothetical protein AB8B55_24560 [Mariniblastus sp.]